MTKDDELALRIASEIPVLISDNNAIKFARRLRKAWTAEQEPVAVLVVPEKPKDAYSYWKGHIHYLQDVSAWPQGEYKFYTFPPSTAKLQAQNKAQLAELSAIADALGTNEGHSSVSHIERLKAEIEELKQHLGEAQDGMSHYMAEGWGFKKQADAAESRLLAVAERNADLEQKLKKMIEGRDFWEDEADRIAERVKEAAAKACDWQAKHTYSSITQKHGFEECAAAIRNLDVQQIIKEQL